MADRSVVVTLIANYAPFASGMTRASAAATAFQAQLAKTGAAGAATGGALGAMGKGSMLAMGGASLAAFGLAKAVMGTARAAIDFESSFAGIEKTVNASSGQLDNLAQGMRDLSTEIPINVNELNAIGEAAGQLGIETANILGFTEVMAKLGVTTNLSSEQAATALARLANITQMPEAEFSNLGSTIVALGNAGASTEAEITEMGLRIAGAGEQVGMTEADILGFSTALSDVGINAEAGGTAISKVMINIAREVEMGGDKLDTFADVAGMTAAEFSSAWKTDAAGALASFITGLGQMEARGSSTIGVLEELGITEVRMRDALLRTSAAGDTVNEMLATGNQAWAENNALTKEAEKRFDTAASKIQLAKNEIGDLAITVGQLLMELGEPLVEGTGAFAGLANDTIGGLEDFIRQGLDFSGDYAFSKQQAELEEYSQTVAGVKDPLYAMGVAQTEAAADAEEHTGALRDQVAALDRLKSASGFLSVQSAAFNLQDSKASLKEARNALRDTTKGTVEYRDALRSQRRAQLTVLESQLSLVDAVQSYKEKVESGEMTQRDAVDLIRAYGREAGLSKSFIENLIGRIKGLNDTYGEMPGSKPTNFPTPGLSAAIRGVNALEGALQRIPTTITTTHRLVTTGAVAAGTIRGRASGGSVEAGQPYIVGERGPELFMSTQRGHIAPDYQLRSGGLSEDSLERAFRRALDSGLIQNSVEMDGQRVTKVIRSNTKKNKILLGGR